MGGSPPHPNLRVQEFQPRGCAYAEDEDIKRSRKKAAAFKKKQPPPEEDEEEVRLSSLYPSIQAINQTSSDTALRPLPGFGF